LYKYVEQKKITFVRLPGGDIRFKDDTINEWLEKRTIKAQKKIA
jgi:excisionase family DNA binding protein